MKKAATYLIFSFFLIMICSKPTYSTMYGNLGSLEEEIGQMKDYKKLKGKNKCSVDCYIKWNKSVEKENKRFFNVQYHTRSQTKKNKDIIKKLKSEHDICLKKCK